MELCPVGPTPPSQKQLSTDRSPGTGDPDTLLFNKLAVGFGSRPVPKTRNRLPTSPGGGGGHSGQNGSTWILAKSFQLFLLLIFIYSLLILFSKYSGAFGARCEYATGHPGSACHQIFLHIMSVTSKFFCISHVYPPKKKEKKEHCTFLGVFCPDFGVLIYSFIFFHFIFHSSLYFFIHCICLLPPP